MFNHNTEKLSNRQAHPRFETIVLGATVIASVILAVSFVARGVTNADTGELPLRYFENYRDKDGDNYYKIGYVDKSGASRTVVKETSNVDEHITDTNDVHVSNIKWGEPISVTRSPYQVFDAGEKSAKVTVIGWSDFKEKFPKVKNSTLKVKWYDSVVNSNDSDPISVIEFVYQGHLYRMYMPTESLGYENFKEDVSPSYTTPTLSFDSDFGMTYKRAPYVSYVQPTKSGTVVEK